jgi:hypothetical protein
MEVLGLMACCAVPVMAFAFVAGIINWTLGPLMRAARNTPSPTRFLLSDLLWLMVQLQFAMGLVAWAIPADLPAETRIGGLLFLGLPVVGFWYACLHAVAQTGIEQPLRRAAAFVVLFPGAIMSIVALPALALAWLSQASLDPERRFEHELATTTLQLAVVAATTFSLRWLAIWTVAKSAA